MRHGEPPNADWRFDYRLFAGAGCDDAAEITGANLACWDSKDLFTRQNENAAVESLLPGENHNEIVCLSRGASKTWDFSVCEDLTSDTEAANRSYRFDCGEQEIGELPAGCTRLADSTVIACGVAETTGGVRYRNFGTGTGAKAYLGVNLGAGGAQNRAELSFPTWADSNTVAFRYANGQLETTANGAQTTFPLDLPFSNSIRVSVTKFASNDLGDVQIKDVRLNGVLQDVDVDLNGSWGVWVDPADLADGFELTATIDRRGNMGSTNERPRVEFFVGKNLF